MKHLNIIGVLLLLLFSACGPDPQEARQAARDALDNASIQLDLGNKMEAMRLFKEAERYGLWADDTLTVAHARFNIAANLGYYADKEEIVSLLKAFLVSQVRLARKRKQEAEINAELFLFKQQNQALAQKDAEHEQIQQDYADRLSEALDKEQRIMLLLDNYLNNKRTNLLNDVEQAVFGDKDHWKAMLAVVEEKYPGLWETLCQKYPDLEEDEKKSFILSHFKVSRQEEADYLGTTVNMVDKIRGRVKKKMGKDLL